MSTRFLYFLAFLFADQVFCRRTGAPPESCLNLTPKHQFKPQPKTTNSFKFNVTLYPYMNNEEFVHIEIYSVDRTLFRGFVAQARMANNPEVIVDGTFVPMNGNRTRAYMCKAKNMKGNNTWTHLDGNPKQKVSAFWFPEDMSTNHEIIFLATVVKDVKTYWLHIHSEKIKLGDSFKDEREGEREEEEITTESEEAEVEAESDDNSSNEMENPGNEVEQDEEITTISNDETGTQENEDVEKDEQSEPSNNVNRIVSSALTINRINYSSVLSLIISMSIYHVLI